MDGWFIAVAACEAVTLAIIGLCAYLADDDPKWGRIDADLERRHRRRVSEADRRRRKMLQDERTARNGIAPVQGGNVQASPIRPPVSRLRLLDVHTDYASDTETLVQLRERVNQRDRDGAA